MECTSRTRPAQADRSASRRARITTEPRRALTISRGCRTRWCRLRGRRLERASAGYGARLAQGSTVLISDTPRDVQAGRIGGARVIAAATGSDSAQALRAEGADVVLNDLRDTPAVTELIAGFAG